MRIQALNMFARIHHVLNSSASFVTAIATSSYLTYTSLITQALYSNVLIDF